MKYNCIELTYSELVQRCEEWCADIEKTFTPELVIFIAKAGYPIGETLAAYFGANLGCVSAERKGNRLKHALAPAFRLIPYGLRNRIIATELYSKYHTKKSERHVQILSDLTPYVGNRAKVLLVDDSVDTGASVLQVKQALEENLGYPIKVAALNVWDQSGEIVKVDYALYQNTIIKAPMSKDSKEYPLFLKRYNEYCASETAKTRSVTAV